MARDESSERFGKLVTGGPRVTGAAAKQHFGNLADVPAPCGATVGSFTLHAEMVTCRACKKALAKHAAQLTSPSVGDP